LLLKTERGKEESRSFLGLIELDFVIGKEDELMNKKSISRNLFKIFLGICRRFIIDNHENIS
jgi:hypothetical protein